MNEVVESLDVFSTRDKILMAGFQEMYQHGYQGMRIDQVLSATGLAKGALYHHFPNKVSLAYAIVDEILYEQSKQQFDESLAQYEAITD